MQIKRDVFKFASGVRDDAGQKLEPEQQPATRVMQGTAEVSVTGVGANKEGVVGKMPIEIVAASEAGQVARSVSALCYNCRFWDRAAWLKMLHNAENAGSTEAERHSVNEIRAEILLRMPEPDRHAGSDNEYDVEHALKSMGMCHAMREFYKSKDGEDPGIIGTFAMAGCPEDTCMPDRPMGLFKPRDGDAAKAGAANFDAVMNRAAGKIP